jgi:hypothetical protein
MKLTTHLHVVPMSRMRGAILPFSQYVFMRWCVYISTGTFLVLKLPRAKNEETLGREF